MLGIALVKELSADFEIAGVDLRQVPPLPVFSSLTFRRADITSAREIIPLFNRLSPEVIIHTAAFTDVDGCEGDPEKAEQVNVEGSKNIALAAKETGAAVLYLSTDFIFDGKSSRPYVEEDPPRPLSVYGRTKLKGEEFIRSLVSRHVIIRTSWLFGAGGRNFVDTIISRAKAGEELRVVDDQIGSPTYTADLARAIRKLIEKIRIQNLELRTETPEEEGFYGIYHVANQGSCSWYELAQKILDYAGIEVAIQPTTSEQLGRPARRPKVSILNCGRFRRVFGYSLRPWPEALREYLQQK